MSDIPSSDALILGLDLGGTKSAASLCTVQGEIRYRTAAPTPATAGPDAVIAELLALARAALRAAGPSGNVIGCGLSAGAPADAAPGIVYPAPNLPGWPTSGTPLAALLTDALGGLPVFLENDADATALAEWRFGAGRGTQTMAFLTIGTGIGAGLVLNGRLHRGAFGAGGEIGHVAVDTSASARRCTCGLTGCLEAYASGPSIVRVATERGYRGEPTGKAVTAAARTGDTAAQFAFTQANEMLGRGLALLTMLLNPERIVLGTLAVHAGDLLLPGARTALQRHAWQRLFENLDIVPAALGDQAQDLAAACAFLARAADKGDTMPG